MEIVFSKWSPSQNVTVLVESPVPRAQQPEIAAKLLAFDCVGGEQAGFLEEPTLPGADARLQMMGGEFCGNATLCLGALLARREALPDGGVRDYALEISGSVGLTPCRIERSGSLFLGTVRMPLPERVTDVSLETDAGSLTLPLVVMPGISHIIAPVSSGLTRAEIERRIRSWNDAIRADALGVLLYDESVPSIAPIVYVPATDTAVWERSCGSGTAALGFWKSHITHAPFTAPISQPGGVITVSTSPTLTITNTVRLTVFGQGYA